MGNRTGIGQPGEIVVCPVGVPHSQWDAGPGAMRIYYEHRPALESAELFFETYFGLSRDGKLLPSGDMRPLPPARPPSAASAFPRPTSPPPPPQPAGSPLLPALARRRGPRPPPPHASPSPPAPPRGRS